MISLDFIASPRGETGYQFMLTDLPSESPKTDAAMGRRYEVREGKREKAQRGWLGLFFLRCLGEPLLLAEGKQVGVDLVLESGAHAVWGAGIDLERGAFDDLRGEECGSADGHDLIVVAVKDEGGDIELLQVFGAIGLGEGLDAVVGGGESAHHALHPEGVAEALRHFVAGTVGAIEGRAEIPEELGAVSLNIGAQAVEDVYRQAGRIGCGLEHERRNGADEDRLGDALGSVPANVAGDLPAPRGVADGDED